MEYERLGQGSQRYISRVFGCDRRTITKGLLLKAQGYRLNACFYKPKQIVEAGLPRNRIAFKFHFSLIELMKTMAAVEQVQHIAFSGGVWQNSLLVDLALVELSDYLLFFHQEVSPNDEGGALGQVAVFPHLQKS